MMRYLSRTLLAAAVLGLASPALAQTLNINASVAKSCVVVTNTATIAIPAWDPLAGAPTDGSITYSVKCTKGTTISVAASLGAGGAGATGYPRSLVSTSASDKIGYKLFAGNGTTSTELTGATAQSSGVAGLGKNVNSIVTMTASLDANADPKAATDYSDQVVLTFTAN